MSFPFRFNVRPDTFGRLVEHLRSVTERFPDQRTGSETVYSMADAALGAFSVFFTQSPSFLDFQRTLQVAMGCNNALSLFGITQIPRDNQIRNLLDPVPPSAVLPVFAAVVDALHAGGQLEAYRTINGDVLVSMDGTQYFSSSKIHCPQCRVSEHHSGTVTSSHSVVTPVIVAPGKARVIPLEPEFITPQDGHAKQDCENAAAKRWLAQFGTRYAGLGATLLGDDLYCKQPLGAAILREGLNFILVCKPDSHKTLYEWVAGLAASGDVHTRTITHQHWGNARATFSAGLPLQPHLPATTGRDLVPDPDAARVDCRRLHNPRLCDLRPALRR
jgi:hypothetical protein